MSKPRILVLDIETSPALVYTWGLFDQNIGIGQVKEPTRMLCWAAKWHGEPTMYFGAEWEDDGGDWLRRLHALLSEADAVCHYNGTTFDMPHITRELEAEGCDPLPPIPNVDLLKTVRKFRLLSNKLDWAAGHFLNRHKVKHEGFQLWLDVMDRKDKALRKMERYCRGDVKLTDNLLTYVKPYVNSIPTATLFNDGTGCPSCQREGFLVKRGFSYAKSRKYQRYFCTACRKWSKDTRSSGGVTMVGV